MNLSEEKKTKLRNQINSLTVGFAFFLRNDILKVEEDYEFLEDSLDQALKTIPSFNKFPSQIILSESNLKAAEKELDKFLGSLSEGKE